MVKVSDSTKHRIQELINGLSDREKEIFRQVIKAELAKLHMSSPRGITEDLEAIVRNVIK